ncbi:MAG: PadR family transcriptional regulator [Novosphingobium sp.]
MRMHGCGPRWSAKMGPMGMVFTTGRHWGRGWGGSWGGDWGERGRGSRGPRGRVFGSGELRLVLLKLIADQSRHGYELIKAIEELTGGAYAPSPGVVYPTLSLLTDEGVVSEAADGARKAYAVTEAGTAELADRADEAEALLERLKALGEDGEKHRAPPIARAVGNLFNALRHRAQGEFDKETIHQVAEILDEAARKIERL